ncbi:MAG TPA: DUF4129 domain-containing protein [Actinomycetota bacterium]|nr:DUF4129 domain-containing protein [Actinomycetota bacterium]
MIAPTRVAPPEPRELRACGLAALAESGVLALPVWLLLTETRGLEIGVVALAVPFMTIYVGAVLLACRFRASRHLPLAAIVVAVLAGAWLGRGDLNRSVFAVVVFLLVALRAITLALRDWRLPIHAEFGWFALALGIEVMVSAGANPEWRGPLVVIVPLFFAAALASRAATVWTTSGSSELDERVRASWIRRAGLATGLLVAAMAAAVAFSVRGGVFDRVGAWIAPAANAFASLLAWTLSQIVRPIFWLVDQLGIDPDRVREFFEDLRESAARAAQEAGSSEGPTVWQRILGFVAFAAIGYAVFRVIRRFTPKGGGAEPERAVPASATVSALEEPQPVVSRLRRELPADRVRRWYAETLEILRNREVVKEAWQTPAEFVPRVATAFPACAAPFAELTRAYEDVRYGGFRLAGDRLGRLEKGQETMIAAMSSSG